MAAKAWLRDLALKIVNLARSRNRKGAQDKGILAFANTSEVIAAERLLKTSGFEVEVKGPPPELQTGCDMVVIFPLLKLAAIKHVLAKATMKPEAIVPMTQLLLEPVSLFKLKDMDSWLMVRAANMKITIDKRTGVIVNISGGGCPDVPWLAAELTGKKLSDAPEPISFGHTLCCYSLQKAFEELKRIWPCG